MVTKNLKYSKTIVKIIICNLTEVRYTSVCLNPKYTHACKSVKKMSVQIEWIEFKHCLNVYWSMGIYLHKGEASA